MKIYIFIIILTLLSTICANNTRNESEEHLNFLDYICQPMSNALHITFHKNHKRMDPIGMPCFAQWNEDNTDYPNPETIECRRHYEGGSLSKFTCKAYGPNLWTRYMLNYQVQCMFVDLDNKGVPKYATNPVWIEHKIPTGTYCSIGFNVIYNSTWIMCWWWIVFVISASFLSFCFNIAFKIDVAGYFIAIFALLTSVTAPIIMLFFYELLHFVSIKTCIVFNIIFTTIFAFSTITSAFFIIQKFIRQRMQYDYSAIEKKYGADVYLNQSYYNPTLRKEEDDKPEIVIDIDPNLSKRTVKKEEEQQIQADKIVSGITEIFVDTIYSAVKTDDDNKEKQT